MPRRTIADATSAFENMEGLSDVGRRDLKAELDQATSRAAVMADEMVTDRVNAVATVREEALADLCAVRDGYADLIKQAELGRITAADYEKALNELRGRQRAGERHIARIDQALAFVETVEADPVAYADSLYAKFPLTMPEFSF